MSDYDTFEDELKPAHRRAVRALVATGSVVLAAADCGVSQRTLRRWMADDYFREELRAAEIATLQTTTRRLGRLAERALQTLEEVMDNKGSSPNHRIRAASVLLETTWRWQSISDLERRLAVLERQAVAELPDPGELEIADG